MTLSTTHAGRFLAALTAVMLGLSATFGDSATFAAGDSDADVIERVNTYIERSWQANGIEPSPRASDGEWARRVTLDVVGHIPSYERLMNFLEDDLPDKRAKYVDALLNDPDYVRHWTNIWANLLVGRAADGDNRRALERWLRRALYRNMPYNEFVYELISAEGSVQENGAVAYVASHLNENAVPATSRTSRLFLGLQVQCTQCHNHPFNDWKQSQFWSMNGFFRGTRRQGGNDDNPLRLTDNPTKQLISYEKRNGLLQMTRRQFVDGTTVTMDNEAEPREQLAKLVTDPGKPYMARALVNRMWGHFFGYGFTRPIDDMGPHNPPSHPELLEYLTTQFKESGYDVKRLIRWITRSRPYNLTSTYGEHNAMDNPSAGNTPLFSKMYLKQFTAEQLYDSLLIATDADKSGRTSGQAQKQRRAWLRQFVRAFGTDENDEATTFNGTIPQALLLMNGNLIQSAVNGKQGSFLRKVLDAPGGDLRALNDDDGKRRRPRRGVRRRLRSKAALKRLRERQAKAIPKRIETLFLVTLARKPTQTEMESFDAAYKEAGYTDPIVGLQDVFWALLNSNEFIINH